MKTKALLLLLLAGFLFASCTRSRDVSFYDDQGQPAYGDALVTGSIGEPSNLIPLLATDSASHEIAGYIYNGLVKYDKDLTIVGDLAESWDISRDNLTITFHLKKGVTWQDGKPFTAHDVLSTYKIIVDPKTPTAYASDFQAVREAKVLDDHTFRVTYKTAFAPGLISWGLGILPRHLVEGKEITSSPLIRKPVGTGPYVFKEWIPGERVTVEANKTYFEGQPYLSRRVTRIIPDTATMFLELKRGVVDLMGLTPLQYVKQTEYAGFRREFNKYRYLASTYVYLGYNLRHPFFKDKRVRQALCHAIDKQEIIDGILLGQGVVAHGPYKPGMWAYNKDIKNFDFNITKARTLLSEAGFVKGPDGVLRKDGRPFEFTVLANQGNDVRIRCAELIQRRLDDIGIKVKIRVIEWAAFINEFIDKKNFDAVILGWTIPNDPDMFDIWHSSKQGPKEFNFIGFENREVDDLLVKARHTFDKEERRGYYFRIQEILADEQPYTFLFVPYANVAVHKRVKGIKPAPAGISYNFPWWYVPEGQMRYRTHASISP